MPKTNLIMCVNCGHDYEAQTICGKVIRECFFYKNFYIFSFILHSGNCYAKVKQETKEMNREIQKKLQLDPVEQEVIVLYEGEKENQTKEFWKVSHIIIFFITNI